MLSAPSLWEQIAVPGDHLSEDAVDAACDVAVVGAGFTGLRAALCLAERGTSTIVLDARDVGWGASGRNGGQVNPMLPVQRPEDLRKAVGDVYFERLTEVSLNSADELFDLVRRYGIACDARQNGWLRVDHCPAARDTARKAATAWNAFGAGFEFVDGEALRRLTGSPAYESGVISSKGGAVQPLSLVRGLADAARKAGARIFRNAPVSAVERSGEQWILLTGGNRIRARSVVLATNGYTDGLFPGLARSILPVYPVQIATDGLSDDEIGAVLPEGHTISDTRRMIMYARRGPGNQAVFGGIGFRKPFGGLAGRRWLLQDVARIFPSLRGVRWRYFWGGRIALTPDRVPHLHEPAPGIVAGLGYNGRGVAMSLVMGRILADRLWVPRPRPCRSRSHPSGRSRSGRPNAPGPASPCPGCACATPWNFDRSRNSGTLDQSKLDLRGRGICFIVDGEACPATEGTNFVQNER